MTRAPVRCGALKCSMRPASREWRMLRLRPRPLPRARARGALVVPAVVAETTAIMLREFGAEAKRHEGLVYWAGRAVGPVTYVMSAVAPRSDHGPYRVLTDERAIGAAAREARRHQLGLVAQVHSHPGHDTRHSDGDDELGLERLGPLDVGDVALVGAGAVGQAIVYWLAEFGHEGQWDVIDADLAALDNTNRSLAIVPADAGWFPGQVTAPPSDLPAVRAKCFENDEYTHQETAIPPCRTASAARSFTTPSASCYTEPAAGGRVPASGKRYLQTHKASRSSAIISSIGTSNSTKSSGQTSRIPRIPRGASLWTPSPSP